MTFTKTSLNTWESIQGNRTFYIDREIENKYSMYYLTILENDNVILQGSDFFKFSSAKFFAEVF
jgi:hypothetical protein